VDSSPDLADSFPQPRIECIIRNDLHDATMCAMKSIFFIVNCPDDILDLGRVDCPSAFEQIAFVFLVFLHLFIVCLVNCKITNL
jgi:hypothetical protein